MLPSGTERSFEAFAIPVVNTVRACSQHITPAHHTGATCLVVAEPFGCPSCHLCLCNAAFLLLRASSCERSCRANLQHLKEKSYQM